MTTDRTNRYSRRAFLKALGAGMGMLPLLNCERALAQTAGVVKRMISITWTNGVVASNFYPPEGPLTGPLPPILAPLEPWKSRILAMRGPGVGTMMGGVDLNVMVDAGQTYNGHQAYPSLLTGSYQGATPSIDTLIGDQLKMRGFAAPQMILGCRPASTSTSWRAGGMKNVAETDPYRVYTRLFGVTPQPPSAAVLARRKSVIDGVIEDINTFAARLGKEDRVKIDAHLESVRAIEKQLLMPRPPPAPSCTPPPNTPAGLVFSQVANYPQHVKLMVDIIAVAVRCDIARVFTLDLIDDGGGNSLTFPWLGIASQDYHTVASLGRAGYPQKTLIDAWFYAQVADLAGQLAGISEGSSTALDNTVVLVSNDMNEGALHMVKGLPYLIVGSGAGFFKQGVCVQFPGNVPNNQLLTSVCHAMDLQVPSVGTTYAGDLDAMLKA